MGQKAKRAGLFGQLDNRNRRPDFKASTQQTTVEESNVISLPTPTFPCANPGCTKSTHGWGTLDGDKHVCGKKCHDEYLAKKEKTMRGKKTRKKVALILGSDGIKRPANLPTKAGTQK